MRNLSSGMRIVLVAALSVFPYLLGTVLTLFNVWVDVLALLPVLVVITCVYFNAAESAGVFLLLQGIQLLCAHGYSWLWGRSYSAYIVGQWVAADIAEFGVGTLTVLTILASVPLAIAKGSRDASLASIFEEYPGGGFSKIGKWYHFPLLANLYFDILLWTKLV